MQIVTNPGSNVPPKAVAHYGIVLAPQRIVVDGTTHDTREEITLAQVDQWVHTAVEFPHVVGTTAHELTAIFKQLAENDDEILAITTSRRIVQSHAAAVSAARIVGERPQFAKTKITVFDSTFTDLSTCLMVLLAGEAKKADVPMDRVVKTLETMATNGRFALALATLDNMVKGGRAGFLRAWLADVFKVKPLIGFVNGELTSIGRMASSADRTDAIIAELVKAGKARKVWAAIAHGGALDEARVLETKLRATFDVAYVLRAPLSASIYLYGGPSSIFGAVFPVDKLDWTPPVPPNFSI